MSNKLELQIFLFPLIPRLPDCSQIFLFFKQRSILLTDRNKCALLITVNIIPVVTRIVQYNTIAKFTAAGLARSPIKVETRWGFKEELCCYSNSGLLLTSHSMLPEYQRFPKRKHPLFHRLPNQSMLLCHQEGHSNQWNLGHRYSYPHQVFQPTKEYLLGQKDFFRCLVNGAIYSPGIHKCTLHFLLGVMCLLTKWEPWLSQNDLEGIM